MSVLDKMKWARKSPYEKGSPYVLLIVIASA